MKNSLFFIICIASSCWGSDTFEYVSYHQGKGTQTIGLNKQQLADFLQTATVLPTAPQKPVYTKLITHDGYETGYYFFNRNSSTLVIVGPGILNKADQLTWVSKLFGTYDIAVMDFRCNKDIGNFLLSSDTLKNPKQALLYNVARDVTTTINSATRPRHTKLVGYGYCYGGWIFSLFQAFEQTPRRFDCLIFDSLPQSLERLLNNILKDANVMGPRQPGHKPGLLQKITALPLVRKPVTYILTQALADFSIIPALAGVKIPVLFIQGKNDRVASMNQFRKNFDACGSNNKFALLTPYEHVENFKQAPTLCAGVCSKFIEGTFSNSLFIDHALYTCGALHQ